MLIPSVSANSKTLQDTLKVIGSAKSALKDKSVYIFTADSSKLVHGCYMSPAVREKGNTDAGAWATAVAKVTGGKAGGKGPTALGVADDTDSDKAVEEARKWFEGLGI